MWVLRFSSHLSRSAMSGEICRIHTSSSGRVQMLVDRHVRIPSPSLLDLPEHNFAPGLIHEVLKAWLVTRQISSTTISAQVLFANLLKVSRTKSFIVQPDVSLCFMQGCLPRLPALGTNVRCVAFLYFVQFWLKYVADFFHFATLEIINCQLMLEWACPSLCLYP